MKKSIIAYSICLFFSGCLFSKDEIKDYNIGGNYYVSSFAGKNTLLYKSEEDIKLIGSGTVILNDIDSVGWNYESILAVSKNEYYIIDTATQKIVSSYRGFDNFINSRKDSKLDDYKLKSFSVTKD